MAFTPLHTHGQLRGPLEYPVFGRLMAQQNGLLAQQIPGLDSQWQHRGHALHHRPEMDPSFGREIRHETHRKSG